MLLATGMCTASCTPTARGGATVTIEFWTLALSPFRASIESWIDGFEKTHPGVDVVWVDVPFDASDRKLIAAAAAGRAPDVINLSDRTFGRYVGLGAMADLAPHLPAQARDAYFPGVRSLGEIDAKLLCLPWYLTTQVGMMNTELLKEGGIAPATLARDWRGLQQQARAFRAKTGKYLFSIPLGEESQIPILLLGEGLPPLKPGTPGRLAADLTRPEIVEFIRAWVDLYRAGDMPPEAATRDHAHLLDMYQNRRLATVDTGANFLKRIKQAAPGVYGATELRPPIVGALGRAHIATMIVGVTTQSTHPKLAAEFAQYITSAKLQGEFCALAPILPSTPETLTTSPVFATSVGRAAPAEGEDPKVAQGRSIAAAALPTGVAFTPALECWPDLRRALEEGMKRALIDGEPVDAMLARVNVEWQRILDASSPAGMSAVPTPSPSPAPVPAGRVAGEVTP